MAKQIKFTMEERITFILDMDNAITLLQQAWEEDDKEKMAQAEKLIEACQLKLRWKEVA